MQPSASRAAVPNENSSAPSSAAMQDVAAGLQAAVHAQAHAAAQALAREHLLGLGEAELPRQARVLDRGRAGEAPVPPSAPAIWTTSAPAFTTPAATVPTPDDATSFTETSAEGFTCRRSKISCARSSIE